jgi:hypothetical protein
VIAYPLFLRILNSQRAFTCAAFITLKVVAT